MSGNSKLNIFFLFGCRYLNPQHGGVERVTSILVENLKHRGNNVNVISIPTKNKRNIPNEELDQIFLPDSEFCSKANKAFLSRLIPQNRQSIFVNQGGNHAESTALSAFLKTLGVPVVSVCHCGLIDSAKNYRAIHEAAWKRRGLGWLLPLTDWTPVKKLFLALYKKKYQAHYRKLCAKSDRVVLLSENFKKELAFYFDGEHCPGNVVAIPNPCSFPPPETAPNPAEKRKELLFCGRIDFSQKRVDLMLEIWRRLFKAFPDWCLTIVGGGAALDSAKRMAKKMGLDRVSFEGFQDPRPYYERAAIFCMTSAWETFGLVLVEAMNYGCVPVAFNSYAAAADIIDDGENGILVPPMDCEKYANALAALMHDSALRERMAEAAQEKSLTFSINNTIDRWENLFTEIRNQH